MKDDLSKLIEVARERKLTPQDIETQRENFALGNSADGDSASMTSVRAASEIMKSATK